MRAWAIARVNLKRFFTNRSNIFSMFLLPFLIVLLLGATSGGAATPKVGFHAESPDELTAGLSQGLEGVEGHEVVEFDDPDDAIRGVERGNLRAAILLPDAYAASLLAGDDVEIRFVSRSGLEVEGVTGVIDAVVTQQATLLRAARFAETGGYGSFTDALALAQQVQLDLPPVEVVATTAGEPFVLAGLGQFDIFAQNMLVLFIFMTTLSGAVNLVESRRLGVTSRVYSTPTTVRTMIAGEGLSRMTIALIQGFLIFIGTWLMFGVDWGNPVAAVLVILVFAAVSSAAAMLLGAFVNNEQQTNGLASAIGLGLAALGGTMMPLAVFEILSETVYRVAHITPHAWALEAFMALVAEDGGILDIAGFLLILVGYAAFFLAIATWRLRRVLVR